MWKNRSAAPDAFAFGVGLPKSAEDRPLVHAGRTCSGLVGEMETIAMGKHTAVRLDTDADRLIQELRKETDRGVALTGSAFLENALEWLLRARFVNDEKSATHLFRSSLRSFQAKTEIAYLLGLISLETRNFIDAVRLVRNQYAHRYDSPPFSECVRTALEAVKPAKVMPELKWLELDPKDKARQKVVFILGVAGLCHLIIQTTHGTKPTRPRPGETALGPAVTRRLIESWFGVKAVTSLTRFPKRIEET